MPPPLRILIVDDEKANALYFERALARGGHTCVTAASGEEALERFTRERFDLVLMDIMLPGISGFETTTRLRAMSERWLPIIFLSALDQPIDVVAALDAGGDDYITKPVDPEILLARVAAAQRVAERLSLAEERALQLRRYIDLAEKEKTAAAQLFARLRREDRPDKGRTDIRSVGTDGFSGDFVAVRETPDGRIHLVLADAAGHGLLAASQLFPLIEMFNELALRGFAMTTLLSRGSVLMRETTPLGSFISACFATIDAHSGLVEVWNAGMPDALLLDAEGRVKHRFASRFLPLGIEATADVGAWEPERAEVALGDRLVMYSDGLIEARRGDGESFGSERLIEALAGAMRQGGTEFVFGRLEAFLDGENAGDDVSLCIQTVRPSSWSAPRERVAPPLGLKPSGSVYAVALGPRELRQLDVAAHVLSMLQRLGNEEPRVFERLFTVVSHLMANAIDWGVLGLAPGAAVAECRAARWRALQSLTAGQVSLTLRECRDSAGARWWEIEIADSGRGFDHAAWSAGAGQRRLDGIWRGLDLAAALCGELVFSDGGRRVRACLPA